MLNYKRFIAVVAILSLVTTNLTNVADAASLSNAKDSLSTSDLGVVSTHTVTFTNHVALNANDTIEITMPSPANVTPGLVTCPLNFTASAPFANTARCTASTSIATGTFTVIIPSITNPSTAGSQDVTIVTRAGGTTAIESITVRVAYIDKINVSASVPSTLTFSISGVSSGTAVNAATTTLTSSSTALAFGNLQAGTSSIIAQQLSVVTNASAGYSVTVQQNQNLTSSGGSQIATFKDGTATTSAWANPSAVLDSTNTYGHFGLTSNDWTLTAGDTFGASSTAKYSGFNGTAPIEVLYHTGVADGVTISKGMAQVAYRLQVSALQPAGDYSNILTYIATPTY
ncbi:MAG: hypothetical protein WCG01_02755 [bacterium]